ncbi:MAG: hypothetical protein GXN93_02995 [Candidatus Diapherotrites archaeon]|nr:hypothetical protein [Candidatus Diapherotrites archaeon]
METAIAIIVILIIILVAVGQPWLAIILAFGGALAIAGAPPKQPKPKKEWGDIPVPQAGGYPGWDFWKGQIEGATETAMKALRLGTGIQYAADALSDFHKKTLWDADVPIQWYMTPWGPMLASKKANLAELYQLMSEAAAIEQRIKVARDPEEVKKLREQLAEIRKKIEKVYGKGEGAES